MAGRREIGAIDLQEETRLVNRLVLFLHSRHIPFRIVILTAPASRPLWGYLGA
jgi:hypothetical protein